jgi:hypothetical protein
MSLHLVAAAAPDSAVDPSSTAPAEGWFHHPCRTVLSPFHDVRIRSDHEGSRAWPRCSDGNLGQVLRSCGGSCWWATVILRNGSGEVGRPGPGLLRLTDVHLTLSYNL